SVIMHEGQKKAIEEQFDKSSHQYVSKYVKRETIREKQRVLNLVTMTSHFHNVLDIGCGPGTMSDDLLRISDHVWGVDVSQCMVKLAIEKFKDTQFCDRVHFEVGD